MGRYVRPGDRPNPSRSSPLLSEVTPERIEIACDGCQRRGSYRTTRLLSDFGDVSIVELRALVAERGKCVRALFPPAPNDLNYQDKICKARFVGPLT